MEDIFPNAWLAVDFFFTLSGFIIAHSYGHRIGKDLTVVSFVKLRIIRLYPIYFLAITIGFLLSFFGLYNAIISPAFSYLAHIFLVPTPQEYQKFSLLFPFNFPAWSLHHEILVNIIFIYAIRVFYSNRLYILNLLALACLIIFTLNNGDVNTNIASDWLLGFARAMWSFFIGITIHKIYSTNTKQNIPIWVGVLIPFYLIGVFAASSSFIFHLINIIFIFPLIVYLGGKVSIPYRFQNIAEWLGRISYPVYILHMVLLNIILFFYFYFNLEKTMTNGILAIIATILVAEIILRLYDTPVRRYLTKRLS